MDSKQKDRSRIKKLKQIEPQESVDPEFDELVNHEIVLHSPQGSDYETLVPLSGSEPEKPLNQEPESLFRSDKELFEEVVELLSRHPEIDIDEIQVQVDRGEVLLTGAVPEEKMKILCGEVIKLLPGVRAVSNQLRHLNV